MSKLTKRILSIKKNTIRLENQWNNKNFGKYFTRIGKKMLNWKAWTEQFTGVWKTNEVSDARINYYN